MSFGSTLRQHRKNRELSQDLLGDAVGCSRIFISYIENGKRYPSVALFHKLVTQLKLTDAEHKAFRSEYAKEQVNRGPIHALPAPVGRTFKQLYGTIAADNEKLES